MRDRSTLPPEASAFPADERTLEQRYEDCRAERDDLEVKVQTLTELILDLATGKASSWDVLAKLSAPAPSRKPRRQTPHQAAPENAQPVVYYLRRDDRTVKIGVSRSIVSRLQAFHAQPADLIAVEPGGHTEERARHQQFNAERIGRTELFQLSDQLAEHIAALQQQHPDPLDTAQKLNRLGQYAGHHAAA